MGQRQLVNKNYIVLNGKHYDAVTGALIKSVNNPSHATHTRVSHPVKPAVPKPKVPAAHAVHPTAEKLAKKTSARQHHHVATKVHATRKPQNAKTLMRHAVQKPSHDPKPHVRRTYPLAKQGSGALIKPKISVASVDSVRSRRAQDVHKSKHVARFATAATTPVATKVQPLAIKAAPVLRPAVQHKVQHAAHPPKTMHEKKSAILEQALANATSHEEKAPAAKRRFKHKRLVSSLAGMAAVLVVVGFVAYLNKASVELQVASVKAGFQASLPGYTPTGYERKSAQASDGKVAINFTSPSSNGGFTLTQEASSWDSQTLFDSVVAQDNTTYQTVQSHGRTIYIYGEDKAAWVDGGILYKVNGNTKLNSDQVISLATSM